MMNKDQSDRTLCIDEINDLNLQARKVVQDLLNAIDQRAMQNTDTDMGFYAWKAGCLHSILTCLASKFPEIKPFLEENLEWHISHLKDAEKRA